MVYLPPCRWTAVRARSVLVTSDAARLLLLLLFGSSFFSDRSRPRLTLLLSLLISGVPPIFGLRHALSSFFYISLTPDSHTNPSDDLHLRNGDPPSSDVTMDGHHGDAELLRGLDS